jgi:hypothetical protein
MPLVHTEEVTRSDSCSGRMLWRPVRVQAPAMAAGTIAVPRLGHVPVLVAVGGVAVLAEPCIVLEPGRVDLGEAERRPERLGDSSGAAGVDGVTVAVGGGDAFEPQIPLSWLALPDNAGLH